MFSDMGLKCLRTSIAWTRIFQKVTKLNNEEGLQFYDDLFDELLKYNIQPVITGGKFGKSIDSRLEEAFDETLHRKI